jgi:hypothetical protein
MNVDTHRRIATLTVSLAIATLIASTTIGLAGSTAKSSTRAIKSQSESALLEDELTQASIQNAASRVAPGTTIPALAFTSARTTAATLSTTGGSWSEITNKPYNSDALNYRDPVFSNSSGGSGLVSGRMTALAVDKDGTVWAGGADGGVWKSTNGGGTFTAVFDGQASLSIGAISVNPADNSVWVGTGENNTAFENYRGVGVLRSSDGGATWTLVGGTALDSTTIGKLEFDGRGNVYAATSHGLYRTTANGTGAWIKMFDATTFGYAQIPYGLSLVNDVVVRPGTNGQVIVANMAWRNGTAYDAFYASRDGGATWARVKTTGATNDNDIGRSTLAYSADGSKLYALVESPKMLNNFVQSGGSVLQGIYVSSSGDIGGPFTKVAEGRKLAQSGSALKNSVGYNPGVQAWYNQFLGVDPADSNHLYVGLEEVFETTNGGTSWNTIGPYWNFDFACWSFDPSKNTCPDTTHPDQHAIAFSGGTVYVGNDGGVWSRSTSNHQVAGWNNLNASLRTLQYYYAGAGKVTGGDAIWGGLQDNGESLIAPGFSQMVSPFGGDGGDTLVDPNNGDRAVVEYTDLDMALTTNGGRSDGTAAAWIEMTPSCFAFTYTPSPCDPNPRFIAPFRADSTNINHWVAGGQYLWDNQSKGWDTRCTGATCDWKIVYNTGSGNQTTAIAVTGTTTYAGWCGGVPSCNPASASASGAGFTRGLVTNYGTGVFHSITGDLPNRYINSIAIDPANAGHAYVVFGGFNRHWTPEPDPGIGHVFETTNGGTTWTDISGNIPDAPADDVLITSSAQLVVGTDVGVFTASIAAPTTWSRLGTGLPNAAIYDLSYGSDGSYIIAATHGRGLWQITTP